MMEVFRKYPQTTERARPMLEEKVVDYVLELAKVTDKVSPESWRRTGESGAADGRSLRPERVERDETTPRCGGCDGLPPDPAVREGFGRPPPLRRWRRWGPGRPNGDRGDWLRPRGMSSRLTGPSAPRPIDHPQGRRVAECRCSPAR